MRPPRALQSLQRRGAVLLLVLIVMSFLSLLAFSLSHRIRLQLRISRAQRDELVAYYLALGGIERTMVAISEDKDPKVDHFGESWRCNTTAAEEGLLADQTSLWATGGSLSYASMDEEGRLNVNTSSPAAWVHLPRMTEPIIASIVDWRDEDESPQPQGQESETYQRRNPPTRSKNSPMRTVWEISQVMGVEWREFLGEDLNGNGLLDESERDGSASEPFDNADSHLDVGIMDYFTVYGNGKINLNTTSQEVLMGLPGVDSITAQRLVEYRAGSDQEPFTSDDKVLSSEKDIESVSGIRGPQLELLKEYGRFNSEYFRIVSEARIRTNGRASRLHAVVHRSEEQGIQLVLLRRE